MYIMRYELLPNHILGFRISRVLIGYQIELEIRVPNDG